MEEQDIVKFVFQDSEVFEVDAEYEYFHAIVDGIRLIFYPHKVKGTDNINVRVRNGTHQRKKEFLELARILKLSIPSWPMFRVNNDFERIHWKYTPRDKYKSYFENAKTYRATYFDDDYSYAIKADNA